MVKEEVRMKLRNLMLLAVVAVLSLAVVSNAAPAKKLVYNVDRVTAKMEGNTVVIHAYGKVRTGGWTDAELVATKGTATTLAYRFVAVKPTGIVTQMITPIDAEKTTGPLLPPFPRKVKIISETNSKTVSITH
jgi:ABC-type uncharacterized transport system YnjBCD substrate-binding protein